MRIKIRIKLTLLSDSIPGVGQEIGGLVDIDVKLDKNGLPQIPGKRIKGLFKENARDLSDAGLIAHSVDEIFGKSGEKKNDFKLSNGYLKNYRIYKQFLEYLLILNENDDIQLTDIFNPIAIIDYFTYSRTQTAVDYNKGVAKEKSLRIARVLRKGLEFYFNIGINSDHIEDIKKVCKVTRHFGTRRNRGFGHIKFEFEDFNDQELESKKKTNKLEDIVQQFNDTEPKLLYRLNFSLINREQILVTNQAGSKDSTDFFIPGSTILGVFAWKYIIKEKIENAHENLDFYNLFLSDNVKFTNFYPTYKNKIFHPHPYSITKKKNQDEFYDLSIKRPEDIQLIKMKGFSLIEKVNNNKNGEIYIQMPNLSKSVEYHHGRPQDRSIGRASSHAGEFFQYEVLKPNHYFQGSVIGPKKELIKLLELFNSNILEINIGKSRSAQYGNSILEIVDLKKISKNEFSHGNENQVLITLLSDMILRNQNGLIIPNVSIFMRELALSLEIIEDNIKIEKQFLNFKTVGGYSTTWKLPKPQAYALGAGSEFLIKFSNQDSIDLNKLAGKFFGERNSEGYGEIKINRQRFEIGQKKKLQALEIKKPNDFSELEKLVEWILKERMIHKIRSKAHSKANNLVEQKFSKSFIQRIKLFIEASDSFDNLKNIFNSEGIPKDFKEKLEKISTYIYYDNPNNNFRNFDDLIKEINDIEIISEVDEKFTETIKETLNEKSFTYNLYQEFCKTLLKDVQHLL